MKHPEEKREACSCPCAELMSKADAMCGSGKSGASGDPERHESQAWSKIWQTCCERAGAREECCPECAPR